MSDTTNRRFLYAFTALGGLLLAGHLAIWQLSASFTYGRNPWDSQTLPYILIASASGIGLAGLLWIIPRIRETRRLIIFMFAIGLALRGILFFSTPILEDDWHRYLWDGATVANGIDPYKYSPAQAANLDVFGEPLPDVEDADLMRLRKLASEQPEVHFRINYPYVKTIYPPITEGAFALAHIIAPFSLTGWRTVLLMVDLISFTLCLAALRAFGRSALWATLYWWNPIVTLEVFNSGHMDVLITPFLFATLWAVKSEKRGLGALALAGAAGVKIWPVILVPALLRPLLSRPRQLIMAGILFGIVAALLLAPQFIHLADPDQGISVYSASWRRHAFLYSVLVDGVLAGLIDPIQVARYVVAGLTAGLALLFALRSPADGSGTAQAMLATAAVLVFLSPTGYPWYLIWLIPFLPFLPRVGFLTLMITGPLYYFRFLLGDATLIYQWGIVPAAFGIPLVLILADAYRRRGSRV